jgi:HlyD family secretion protein
MSHPSGHPASCAVLGTLLLVGATACDRPQDVVSGTVESRRVTVSSEIAARVAAVHVRQGEVVRRGDPLVDLDATLLDARVAVAQAAVGQARARLALLESGSRPQEIAAAEAELAVREQALAVARTGARPEELEQLEASLEALDASIRLAQLTVERERSLLASGNTSEARFDEAQARLDELTARHKSTAAQLAEARAGARTEDLRAREAELDRARAQLELVREGPRVEEIDAARARLAGAEAELAAAHEEAARARVVAPLDGAVEVVDVEPGELAQPGQPLVALAREDVLRVRTFAPQHVIDALEVSDPLRLTVDGRPTEPIEARVERIWDEAEFTTGNVQTPSDRMLLVFRVDLEVAPDAGRGLRPGATVLVDFASGERR